MLKFESFPAGALGVNCSLVWDPAEAKGVVIDPGGDAARIARRVEELGFQVVELLHTHGHFDHIGATRALQTAWGCPAYLHEADDFLLADLDMQTGLFGMPPVERPEMLPLQAGEIRFGFKVLHTPGHSPGGCCFLGEVEQGPIVFTGDSLFQGGVGRTDLMGGHWEQLEASIRRELFTLDDATIAVPGHGPLTTIGREARSNPYVRRG
ncbi:MAG: putative metal-binding enzyme [Holophagaceae bacterium]|nr:putative metal-binding enzyme [Holophagaceae bacterium]